MFHVNPLTGKKHIHELFGIGNSYLRKNGRLTEQDGI